MLQDLSQNKQVRFSIQTIIVQFHCVCHPDFCYPLTFTTWNLPLNFFCHPDLFCILNFYVFNTISSIKATQVTLYQFVPLPPLIHTLMKEIVNFLTPPKFPYLYSSKSRMNPQLELNLFISFLKGNIPLSTKVTPLKNWKIIFLFA